MPDVWKVATVIPIPKDKNSKNVTDLRPISLLHLPGKVIEHIIHDQLMFHLLSINHLSPNQFRFRPNLSTCDAIVTLMDDTGFNLNNSQLTIETFIDFSKAFDTLDRSQTTLFNNCRSTEMLIRTGVPQGSILGPLLFILCVKNSFSSTLNLI